MLVFLINNKLTFNDHCLQVRKESKLHTLARASNNMCKEKLCFLRTAFVTSQIGYYPLVWIFYSRNSKNSINKLQERPLC